MKKILLSCCCCVFMLLASGCNVNVASNADGSFDVKVVPDRTVAVSESKIKQPNAVEQSVGPFYRGLDPDRDYLVLVNKEHEYEFGSAYDKELKKDLIYVSDCFGESTPVERGAFLAFSMLQQRLREQGTEIALYSAYRTKEDQEWVYDYYGNLEGWSETNTVMPAGYSEHHTGLMIEIVIWAEDEDGKMVWMTETADRQKTHPEFKIVHDNLADFGFIDRYPSGKENVTGVTSEPYEIRFVGSVEVAHEIMDNELCLEEYLESRNK